MQSAFSLSYAAYSEFFIQPKATVSVSSTFDALHDSLTMILVFKSISQTSS